jgi:hypothetical protein
MRRLGLMLSFLYLFTQLWATSLLASPSLQHYADFGKLVASLQAHQSPDETLKEIEKALVSYRNGAQGAKASSPPQQPGYLARAFYGSLAAMRCRYVSDSDQRLRFLQDAIPALDGAIAEVRVKGNDIDKMIVHRVRADVYGQLPDMLKKQKVALKDAATAWGFAERLLSKPQERVPYLLTYSRALLKNGQQAEVAKLLQNFEKKHPAVLTSEQRKELSGTKL